MMLLMMKDIPVMSINFDTHVYKVLNEDYLPYSIRGKLRFWDYDNNLSAKYNSTQMLIAVSSCRDAIVDFLARRILPLDRENAKKILNTLKCSQMQDAITKAKVAISCRAVSLQDNYWVKLEDDNVSWKDVDIRQNRLSNILAQIALHGRSLTLTGKVHTPELTTHGAYAKCWKREDGDLYLYKAGFRGNDEAKVEVEVSNILDKCNVRHLHYSLAKDDDLLCCKCKCMTTDKISMLSGEDFIGYCNIMGYDWFKESIKIDKDTMLKMLIVDYLISNPDRHGMNWGFWYDCDTMNIKSCHPLYDHNNAFDREEMKDTSGGMSLILDGKTKLQAARYASKHVDFKCDVTRKDFLVNSHYVSFKKKLILLRKV